MWDTSLSCCHPAIFAPRQGPVALAGRAPTRTRNRHPRLRTRPWGCARLLLRAAGHRAHSRRQPSRCRAPSESGFSLRSFLFAAVASADPLSSLSRVPLWPTGACDRRTLQSTTGLGSSTSAALGESAASARCLDGERSEFGRPPSLQQLPNVKSVLRLSDFVWPRREVRGQAFRVRNCTNCTVLLMDHSEQTILERLRGCRVLVGACESSVFLRECEDCDVVLYTKQLRTRDCKRLRIGLYSQTRPVIETSTHLSIGAARVHWFSHGAAMTAARLVPLSSRWSEVHDFTSGAQRAGTPHWSRMPLHEERTGILGLTLPGTGASAASGATIAPQPPALPADLLADEEIRVAWDSEGGPPSWAIAASDASVPPTAGMAGSRGHDRLLLLTGTADDHDALPRTLLAAMAPPPASAAAAAASGKACGPSSATAASASALPSEPDAGAAAAAVLPGGFVLLRSRVLVVPAASARSLAPTSACMGAFVKAGGVWPAVITAMHLRSTDGPGSAVDLVGAAGCSVIAPSARAMEAGGAAAGEAEATGTSARGASWCSPAGDAGGRAAQSVFLDWDAIENKR